MPNLLQILLLEYLDLRWNPHALDENPNITVNYIKKYKSSIIIGNKKWYSKVCRIHPEPISYVATAKWEDIYNEFDPIQLESYNISINPNITWEIIKANPNIKWNYSELSRNLNVTAKIVADNPKYDWMVPRLCENPNMKWKHLKKYHKILEQIMNDSDRVKQCIGNALNENPNITWEIYNKHLKPTSYNSFLCINTYCINPTITYENIKCIELTNFDFSSLSRNKFKYSTDLQHVWQKRLIRALTKLKKQTIHRMLRYKICIPRHFI